MTSTAIFRLHAVSQGRPYLVSGALPVGYFKRYFNGDALPLDWAPPDVEAVGLKRKFGDMLSWKSNVPLVSASGVKVFTDLAGCDVEFRPFVELQGRHYFAMNVLRTIAEVEINRTGKVDGQRVCGEPFPAIFRLDKFVSPVFVRGDVAVELVNRSITAVEFREPWREVTAELARGANVALDPLDFVLK